MYMSKQKIQTSSVNAWRSLCRWPDLSDCLITSSISQGWSQKKPHTKNELNRLMLSNVKALQTDSERCDWKRYHATFTGSNNNLGAAAAAADDDDDDNDDFYYVTGIELHIAIIQVTLFCNLRMSWYACGINKNEKWFVSTGMRRNSCKVPLGRWHTSWYS